MICCPAMNLYKCFNLDSGEEDCCLSESFDHAKAIRSVAYHEAGHAVAAVRQGFRFLPIGMHALCNDVKGAVEYCHREPGNKQNESDDQNERRRTIVALFAGAISQRRFYSGAVTDESWEHDRDKISELIEEMNSPDPCALCLELRRETEDLVNSDCETINTLATELLARPCVGGQRALSASEIKGCLAGFGLAVEIAF
jgi:hypothetical protein